MSEKTLDPTPQRLREARKKGQIARSKMLGPSIATLGGLVGAALFADGASARLKGLTVHLLSTHELPPTSALWLSVSTLALCAAPPLAGALFGAALVGVGTVGFEFNPSAVAPSLEKLNPAEGFKKLFSLRNVVDVLKGLLVLTFVVWAVFDGVEAVSREALSLPAQEGGQAMAAVLRLLSPVVLKAAVLTALLGGVDYALARRRHFNDLKMSRDEVKREHKSAEGDPQAKAQRKSLHRQLASGGQARGVQKASAIVVNPTHIAVALRYDESECDAPYIVAKAREEDALKLRKQAKELGIPIIKDIPLARTLVHYDVGEEVPEELYQAAAAILKVALEGSGEADAKKGGAR